jgi:hypothetical protein
MPIVGQPLWVSAMSVPNIGRNEAARAVDRIEDPDPLGIGANRSMFLADDAVIGAFPLQYRADRGLGGAVGLRHRRLVRLDFHVIAGAEEGTNRFSGGIGKAVGESQVVAGRHGGMPSC